MIFLCIDCLACTYLSLFIPSMTVNKFDSSKLGDNMLVVQLVGCKWLVMAILLLVINRGKLAILAVRNPTLQTATSLYVFIVCYCSHNYAFIIIILNELLWVQREREREREIEREGECFFFFFFFSFSSIIQTLQNICCTCSRRMRII